MHFPRVIRLDESDAEIYDPPAAPGEWAVVGSFAFWDAAPESLTGKKLQAFQHGFLGIGSFGWSTLVEIAEIDDADYRQVTERLAAHLVERYGAPNVETALPAAREETEYAAAICEHERHTLIAIAREFGPEGIVESLKIVRPRADNHEQVRLWSFTEDPP